MNNKPFIDVHCKTCRKTVIYTSDQQLAQQRARYHHAMCPGHWITASIENPITKTTTTVDVPNRELPQ